MTETPQVRLDGYEVTFSRHPLLGWWTYRITTPTGSVLRPFGSFVEKPAAERSALHRIETDLCTETVSGAELRGRAEGGNPSRLDTEEVVGLAFEAAGAASAPFMRDHPRYVMPTEEIGDGVRRVLADHGITELPEGYRDAGSGGSGS